MWVKRLIHAKVVQFAPNPMRSLWKFLTYAKPMDNSAITCYHMFCYVIKQKDYFKVYKIPNYQLYYKTKG